MQDDYKKLQALREFVGGREIKQGLPFWFIDEEIWYDGADAPELTRKAEAGDAVALEQLASYTLRLCNNLELLAQRNEAFVKSVASTFSSWPVSLSLSKVTKGRARDFLEELDVGGENAFLPSYPAKTNDPDNLWNRYALNSLVCLRLNQRDIPAMLAECAKATRKFNSPLLDLQTEHAATWFDVGNKVILITEWQRWCVDLPKRLTKENVLQFMKPARYAIRQFWGQDQKAFDDVKTKAANLVTAQTTGQYIDRALQKIEQAMCAMAHK